MYTCRASLIYLSHIIPDLLLQITIHFLSQDVKGTLLAVMVTFGPRQVLPAMAADPTWTYGDMSMSLDSWCCYAATADTFPLVTVFFVSLPFTDWDSLAAGRTAGDHWNIWR
jgi:hypothetical protein